MVRSLPKLRSPGPDNAIVQQVANMETVQIAGLLCTIVHTIIIPDVGSH